METAQEERSQAMMAAADGGAFTIRILSRLHLDFPPFLSLSPLPFSFPLPPFPSFLVGELEKALEHYTNAILANPKSALLYAKRGG